MAIKYPKCKHENSVESFHCGKCALPLKQPENIPPLETIEVSKDKLTRRTTLADIYEIIEELCKGGMGQVYWAEYINLKQEVTLNDS